ncbi:MAG: tetraacyldisaccharide 4'-kinase, partial [Candidatus Latescibacterota bacterium]
FLRGKRVLAASGIGRPESFERLLESCGAEVAGRLRFPDHHRFAPPDRARIREEAARIGAIAVTTEKDRCRLTEEETRRAELHVLEVRPRFDDPGGIVAALLVRLRGGSL